MQRRADYLYSRSTFQLIDDAKIISNTRTIEYPHQPVIRLQDVAATLLLRLHGSDGEAKSGADHIVEQRLVSALSFLPATEALNQARAERNDTKTSEAPDADAWVLDADLVDTCGLAAHLVGRTQGRVVPSVDLDDFVIALLVIPVGQSLVFETFLELDISSPELTIGDVLREVLGDRYSRDTSFWDEILREIDHEAVGGASRSGLETRLPDYVADRPIERLRDDVLDFRGDARAVAEIVCQREPGPPLAIGLFGDWGSGKSSFMNLLRHEIEQLTGQARMAGRATPFVRRAAHVIFNAWQYSDTQLWPALAENTFAQLRAGGAEGLSRQLSAEVLEELTRKVEGWQDTADGLALDLVEVQREETEKRDQLLKAENERDKQIKAARDEAIEAVGKHIGKSSDGGSSTTSAKATVAGLIDAAEAPQGTTASMRDLVNAVRIAWELKQNRWLVMLGIALALIFAGVAWFADEAWLGQIAPLLAFFVWFNREAQPLVAALSTYRMKRAQAEQTFRAAQRDTDLELARLQRAIRQKENEIRRELSRVTQFKGRPDATGWNERAVCLGDAWSPRKGPLR